jgi:hypothetical protein
MNTFQESATLRADSLGTRLMLLNTFCATAEFQLKLRALDQADAFKSRPKQLRDPIRSAVAFRQLSKVLAGDGESPASFVRSSRIS